MARRGANRVLQIHLPDRWPDRLTRDTPLLRWAWQARGRRRVGVTRLAELPSADEIILVLPVTRVGFVRAQLPAGPEARLTKLAPFAVEDAVVSAPEELHAVVLDETRDGARLVAVLDRTWLASAVSELESLGFPPDRAIVESALIGDHQGTWTLVWSGNGGFVTFGGIEAVTVDAAVEGRAPLALKLAADEWRARGAPPRAVRVLLAEGAEAPDVAGWIESLRVPVSVAGQWTPEEFDADAAACPDLLRGAQAGRWTDTEWLARLRPAAILLGAIVVVHVLLTVGDWARLAFEARGLRSQTETLFRKAFPEAKTVVDPALQMRRNLAGLRRTAGEANAADLVPMLVKLSPALAALGGSPQSMKFERGEIELQLPVAPGETRERLASRLQIPGLRVRIERVATGGGATLATIRVASEGA
jgi:general secretion pathway protein L